MAIHHWPIAEQPRERLLDAGHDQLTDAELLAICLRTGQGGVDAVALARQLLQRFDGLVGLLEASPVQLLAQPGLGPVKVAALKALVGIAIRYAEAEVKACVAFADSQAVRRYIKTQLVALEQEVFACLFLDARHRFIAFDKLFYGSVDRANVHPREVLKRALTHNAAAVILAHNHPSGVAEPSSSDITLTQSLLALLGQVDVRVLDHVVVARGATVSFAERGLL